MRILVTGGRDYEDRQMVYDWLDKLKAEYGEIYIIHGCAKGADSLANEWCKLHNNPVERYPANWTKHRKAAGHIRNTQMLREGKPDRFIAFPGGAGTADMVAKLRQAKVPGIIIKNDGSMEEC